MKTLIMINFNQCSLHGEHIYIKYQKLFTVMSNFLVILGGHF